MEIREHKPYGTWIYGEYNFYVCGRLVAKLRRQLIGMEYAYIYFLPELFNDSNCTRINICCLCNQEVIEKAANIVRKKLYIMCTGALNDMRKSEIIAG